MRKTILKSTHFFAALFLMQCLCAQKPNDTRPQEKEVLLEKLFIEATREKILGNYEEAIARYLEVVQKDANNHVANYELASLYKGMEQFDKALVRAAKAVELDKKSIVYVDLYVSLLEKTGNHTKSAELYAKLIELYPDNQRLYYECAYYWIKAENKDQAIKVYSNLEKRVGLSPELLSRKHKLYISMGKEKKAIQELQAAMEKYPSDPYYPLQIAEYYKNANKTADARKYFEKVLQLTPDNPQANVAMAEIFRQEGDTLRYLTALNVLFDDPQQPAQSKAKVLEPLVNGVLQQLYLSHRDKIMSLAQKMVAIHPENLQGHLLFGHLLMSDNRYSDAIGEYEQVVSVDKNQLEAWVQLLSAYARLGGGMAFLNKTKDFVELYPAQGVGHYYQGLAYNGIGDYVNAQKSLKRAVDMSLSDNSLLAYIQSALGTAWSGTADYNKADEAFNEAMRLLPDNKTISHDYCKSLLTRNANLSKAEELSNKLLAAEPNNAEYMATQAWVLYRKGKFVESIKQFEKAMAKGAGADLNVVERYGDALFRNEDADAALVQWKKALDMGSASSMLKRKIETKKLYE